MALLANREVDLLLSLHDSERGAALRRTAVAAGLPLFAQKELIAFFLDALETLRLSAQDQSALEPLAISDY